MAKTVLKNTNQEAVVKITGIGAETIDISSDILASTQALDGATQTVNIAEIQFTGLATSTITIARNGTTVTSLEAEFIFCLATDNFTNILTHDYGWR